MLTLVPSKGSKSSSFRGAASGSIGRAGAKLNGGTADDHDSWPIRFQPRALKDVALSPQSRGKVKAWLENALADHAKFGDDPGFRPHVLALCGNSGCGKSTLVEALCRDMKIDLLTWSEDSWDIDMKGSYSGGTSRDAVDRLDEVDDMALFVRRSAYPQLDLGGQKASSSSSSSSSSKKLSSKAGTAKAKKSKKSAMVIDSDDEEKGPSRKIRQKIVLMHDLPHSYTVSYNGDTSKADELAALMSSFRDPVVLIVSDIRGADDVQYASRKLLPQSVREKVTFESIFQRPPTVLLMVKGLKRILNECGPAKRALERNIGPNADLETVLTELAESSMGDMRHAVLELGFMAAVQRGGEALNDKEGHSLADTASSSSHSKRAAPSKSSKGKKIRKKGAVPAKKKARVEKREGVVVLDLTQSSGEEEGDETDDFMSSSDNEAGGDDGDGDGDGKFRVAVDAKEGRERDSLYSSLHSSGKLISATLDSHGQFSFPCEEITAASSMDTEMLFLFIQQNLIEGLANTQRVEQFGQHRGAEWEQADLEEVGQALEYCSDVDTFIHRKYDSNALHDRSVLNLFPDAYVCSVVARMVGVSRGRGSTERVAAGKERGAKLDFVPQRRPESLDLARKKAHVGSVIAALNRERMRSGGSRHDAGGGTPLLIAVHEVASSVAPMVISMYEEQQKRLAMDANSVYGGGASSSSVEGGLSESMRFRVQELRRARGDYDLGAQVADPTVRAGAVQEDPMRPLDEPLYLESDDIDMADSDEES